MKKIIIIALFAMTSYAQSYDPNRLLKLDTDLINLFSCSGMVSANGLNNWDTGIFSDEQMIDIMSFNILATEIALFRKGIGHYTEYLEDYNSFVEEGFNEVMDLLQEENFSWDTQSEIDYCQYKINDIILNQPSNVAGVPIESLRISVREGAKERFEFIKKLLEY